ncbi:MAG: carboxy terminal-processing peptidase [Desulfobulbus sp.]|jgi:carboxyl-terminal processing protease
MTFHHHPASFRRLPVWAAVLLFFLLLTPTGALAKKAVSQPFDKERNQMIALILSQQLPAQHFSHQPLDDALSRKAFTLYLKQLDPRKRFLLQSDIDQLNAFATHVDDELSQGRVLLPDAGMQILNERIRQVDAMIDSILQGRIDPGKEEYLEIKPDKLAFAADMQALRERWRLMLKMQVLETYFDSLEEKGKKGAEKNLKEPLARKDIDPKRHPAELKGAIDKVRERTHRALNRLLQQSRQDHYDRYFDAVARAFDPHSNYMAPSSKEDFDIQMSGSLEGIGAMLREDDGRIKVIRIIPGSAAEKQGQLQVGDTILAVGERRGEPVEISEMRIREAVDYIRGPKGSEVRLTVQKPDGTRLVIPIIRDVVRIEETYAKSTVVPVDSGMIGYLRIPSFYRDFSAQSAGEEVRNVTDDTVAELKKLRQQKIRGLILDLRNNGGGALADAVQISGLFLPGGPVVQVKDAQNTLRILEDDDPSVLYDGPLIVLVNQFSASASEILAAALQDYGRGFVIGGDHTHGKGTVQAMMDLNSNLPLWHLQRHDDLGALKLTIQKFYRINGGSTQYKGVEPDLVVPSVFNYLESGEKYMDYSLPWDQVQAVRYSPWKGYRIPVDQAQRAGHRWVESSSAFQKIARETEKAKIRSEQTNITVSLDAMWQERQETANARKEAMAAGLLQEDEEDEEAPPREKKLEELVKTDPYIQVALFLLEKETSRDGSRATPR